MAVIRKSFSGGLSADEEIMLEEWLGSDEENGREYSFLKSLYMWKNPPFAPDEVDEDRMPWRIRRLLLKNSIGTNVFVRAYRIVACLLLIPLAGVLVWALTDRPSDQDSVAMQEVRAPFGICSAVTLPDGSEVPASGAVVLCLHTTDNAKFHIALLLNLFRTGHYELAGSLQSLCDQLFQQLKGFLQLGVGFVRVQAIPDAAADVCP